MRNLVLLVALASVLAVPGVTWGQSTLASVSVNSADEQAIQTIRQRWAGLIQTNDAVAIERLYAANAVLMAPGERAVEGSVAIGARWARQLQLKDFKFSLKPQQLEISASSDLAYERGIYDFAATIPQSPITDTGKYVLVWQKVGGEWKVISDIFNSNRAPQAR